MECVITVESGQHPRSYCPVSLELPWSYKEAPSVSLSDEASGKAIPCQVSKAKNGILLTWLVDGMKPGESRKLLARALPEPAIFNPKTGVALDEIVAESKIDVLIKGEPFTSYHFGAEWVRPFLHPVLGPANTPVTRGWPVVKDIEGERQDHPHHKSIWVAYGECDKVDNWSEETGHGYQRHRKFVSKESGPVFGRLIAVNDWCANNERKQFEETRELCFYALPGGLRLLDVSVTFRMSEKDVVFHDTKEGGLLSVRVATPMDVPRGGRIENAYGGIDEGETWGKKSPWCDYSGVVNGNQVGIAVFDHDRNPRYPTEWHVRNYGLMTANCFAWKHYRPDMKTKGDMAFKKGSKTSWKYRVYVHKGDAKAGRVSDHFLDFIAPPKVTLAEPGA